jgi:putative transposase
MGRPARITTGGVVYHVLNRGNARLPIFDSDGDYEAFLRIARETQEIVPMRVVEYSLMPNHWHLVLWPQADGHLSKFMHRMTNSHVKRWAKAHEVTGMGHLYQGRFKSFPVQDDRHCLTVQRYVLQNALRARLISRAEQWPWSSLFQRFRPVTDGRPILSDGPVDLPGQWLDIVNEDVPEKDRNSIRQSILRGRPYGNAGWVEETARRLHLESSLRDRGRPYPR